jgi:hypothetical protein
MKIFTFIGSLLDRLSVVVGAFLGSQVPEFMQQYTQRLAGHVNELHRLLSQMRIVASHSNKTLEQYIQKFLSSPDPDFARQGELMQEMLSRWEELNQALFHLTHSSIWMRPYVFLKELQYDIAKSTLASFQPGINLSVEGLCYAGAGMLMGWVLYQGISKCISFGYSRVVAVFKQSV